MTPILGSWWRRKRVSPRAPAADGQPPPARQAGRSARANPVVYGSLEGWNWWAWLVSYALFDGRFTAIYGMTFGAGIVILAERYERAGVRVARLHLRRKAALLALGLLHSYLLWYGDFLVSLALCGTLAFLYRGLEPRRLIILGIAIMAIGSAAPLDVAWRMPGWSPEKTRHVQQKWSPPAEALTREIEAYRSGWLGQMSHRSRWRSTFRRAASSRARCGR